MASEQRCSKPGCGARKIVGKPCTDADCPQQWVHHTDYTPVAPVSPDATGKCGELVTELWRCKKGDYALATTTDGAAAEDWKKHSSVEEYVTRSQAEELLAAERANCRKVIEDYHTLATNASKRADDLEADNAALTARVKADELKILKLEERLSAEQASHEQSGKSRDEWRGKAEALEAKLAAAERALEKIATVPAWGFPEKWETTPSEVRQLARAALGGKP